jgi:hypothetical protein
VKGKEEMAKSTHIAAGQLKAYSDLELGKSEREAVIAHLETCSHCQEQLEAMSMRSAQVEQHLGSLAPSSDQVHPTVSAARARFAAQFAEKEVTTMLQNIFAARYRMAWGVLGVVLVLALALAFPSVRAIANSFLGLFRVQQIAVVQVNPGDLPDQLGSSSQLENLLSQNVVVEAAGETQDVASPEEASQLAGIPVRLPSEIEGESSLRVQPGGRVSFEIDYQLVQAVLHEIGRDDIQLPPSIDGATATMEIPPAVAAMYGSCEQDLEMARQAAREEGYDPDDLNTPHLPNCTTLMQMPSPLIEAPPGLNIAQLGEAFLQVMGLSPEEAAQFSQTVDWTTTLVIPIPRYGTSYNEVVVDGVDGILILQDENSQSGNYVLVWVKEDILYALTGPGNESSALQIANSLR